MKAEFNNTLISGKEIFIDKPQINGGATISNKPCTVKGSKTPFEKTYTTLPAVIYYTPTNEGDLIDIDDDSFEIPENIRAILEAGKEDGLEEEPDVDKPVDEPIDISNPKEVTVGVTDEQKGTIDNLVNKVVDHFKGNELLDNVLYKDENGNPKSQVVTKKNDDGSYSKITITYDENGNVKKAAAVKYSDKEMTLAQDGYEITFEYNDDGTITAQPNYGWETNNGYGVNVAVYITPITINPDGSTDIPTILS